MGGDTGGAGLDGYQYKVNSGAWSETIGGGSVELNDIASTGVNVFYLRAIDNATNYDQSPVQTNFYFNDSAPTCPTNLQVDPKSNDDNAFSFSWDKPLVYDGSIDGYYYSINALPTLANTTYTTETTLAEGPYATQQGENTFYVVAKDEAGNYDLDSCSSIQNNPTTDSCAKVTFSAATAAPGAPTGVQIFDISNRDVEEYAATLKWLAPLSQGTGFAGYEIYRSTDGTSYSSVGTTSGTTYADTGLSSQLYHYYIKSKDNAGQYSAQSSTVQITPTGRYTTPPDILVEPSSDATAFSATIQWTTDREGSSFVYYAKTQAGVSQSTGVGQPERGVSHTVTLTGLDADTTYYYQTMWEDSDGNQGRSQTYSFTTKPRPRVYDVEVFNITLNSATITFKTTSSANINLLYGKTEGYGASIEEGSGSQTTNHTVTLTDLEDSSTYHFTIQGTDIDGNTIDIGADFTFKTLERPRIGGFRFENISDAPTTTLRAIWETNVATTTTLIYEGAGKVSSQTDPGYALTHEITISDLADQTTYRIIAQGVDQFGNEAVSDTNNFTTPIDTRPPKVTDVTIEASNIGAGKEDKAQVAVSWKTDEGATSYVEYAQGISGESYSSKTAEDPTLSSSHLVIVSGLDDSTPYHLRACSKDKGGNLTCSDDNTVIPGEVSKSILSILLNALNNAFGWLEVLVK